MSAVLGIDLSTKAVELVLLDETDNRASWDHLELEGADALARLRDLPRRMPRWASRWYEDAGVYLVAIEAPYGRGQGGTEAKLNHVLGAIVACIPPAIPIWLVAPHEYRAHLELAGNAPKELVRQAVLELGAYPDWTQDACDALAVAHYARDINHRGIQAA